MVFFALAVAVVTPAAPSGSQDEFFAEGLTAEEVLHAEGFLRGFHLQDRTDPPQWHDLSIDAEYMRVETDYVRWSNGTALTKPERSEDKTIIEHEGPGSLVTHDVHVNHHIYAFPDPLDDWASGTLNLESSALKISPQVPVKFSQGAFTYERRERFSVPLTDAYQVTLLGDEGVSIEGDFSLVFWEWDLLLTNGSGQKVIQSGHEATDQDGTGILQEHHDRLVFVFVRGGVLSLPSVDGASVELYTSDMNVDAQTFTLQGLRTIDQMDSAGSDRTFTGGLSSLIEAYNRSLVHVELQPAQATGAGLPQGGESNQRTPTVMYLAGWVPSITVVFLALFVLGAGHYARTNRRILALESAAGLGLTQRTQSLSERIRPWTRNGRLRILRARAVASAKAGDAARMEDSIKALLSASPEESAFCHFLRAWLCAQEGRPSAAKKHVISCLKNAPGFYPVLLEDPVLHRIMTESPLNEALGQV